MAPHGHNLKEGYTIGFDEMFVWHNRRGNQQNQNSQEMLILKKKVTQKRMKEDMSPYNILDKSFT